VLVICATAFFSTGATAATALSAATAPSTKPNIVTKAVIVKALNFIARQNCISTPNYQINQGKLPEGHTSNLNYSIN
jgi:hypothetical protein